MTITIYSMDIIRRESNLHPLRFVEEVGANLLVECVREWVFA